MSEQLQQWRLLRQGRQEALGYFFRCYYQDMHRYAQGLLRDQAAAQDQVQQFFLQLWERHPSLPAKVNVRPYIFRALRFAIIDELRRQQRKRTIPLDTWTFEWQNSPDEPASPTAALLLPDALQQLSTNQREILFLRFYNEIPYPEIAEIMGMRYQSVRNAAHRGIKKLRQLMEVNKKQ